MKFENLFHILLFFLLAVVSCKLKPSDPGIQNHVQIKLSADSSAIELYHAHTELLEYLKQDTLSGKQWQSFFAIYADPGEEELREIQKPLEGKYMLQDSLIIFVPGEKFKKGASYFARYYNRHVLDKASDVIRERNLGESEFTEFRFNLPGKK